MLAPTYHSAPHGHGFKWTAVRGGFRPTWTIEPSRPGMRVVSRTILCLSQGLSTSPRIKPLSNDGDYCSKSYSVKGQDDSFELRLVLPVEPGRKTLSHVATTDYVRRKFRLPVPTVRGFDAQWDNHIEFEWLALDHVEGRPLKEVGCEGRAG